MQAPPILPYEILEITERVASGESLLVVLKSLSIPPLKFFRHLDNEPEHKALFKRAKQVALEMFLDESMGAFDGVKTKTDLEIAKAKVAFRQWAAERLIPDSYGVKTQVEVTHNISLREALDGGEARLRAIETTSKPVKELPDPALNEMLEDAK